MSGTKRSLNVESSPTTPKKRRMARNERWSDKEYVLEAIKQYGGDRLNLASCELKNDKEFVLAAARLDRRLDRYALKYASDELLNDKEFALTHDIPGRT